MKWFGKVAGTVAGSLVLGKVGAVAGLVIGHIFDTGLVEALKNDAGLNQEALQQQFFKTCFQLMGHLAKADGRITQEEIAQAENLMQGMGLDAESRKVAISFFKEGSQPTFDMQASLQRFIDVGGKNHNLPIVLLEYLAGIALADGEMKEIERAILKKTAEKLGVKRVSFERLMMMLMAQQAFQRQREQFRQYSQQQRSQQGGFNRQQGGFQNNHRNELKDAYNALGLQPSVSDKELKTAYRKLMSEHHPDKLAAKGVPESMIKAATEKAQDIQAAYEVIKKHRGIKK